MADRSGGPIIPAPTLARIRHAVVVPPPLRSPTRRLLPLAVLDADGAIVPGAECATNRLSSAGFVPAPDQLAHPEILAGTWLYGGLASHHFGHQITRSLGRLQGLASAGKIDGIVFAPLDSRARSVDSQKLMTRLFAGLGITVPVYHIMKVTRIDCLLVGPDLFSEQTECLADPAYVAWARTALRPRARLVPGSKLFVTRGRLDPALGRILCEDLLEQNLARAGYQIFVPEIHSLPDQLDTYASAETIVTTDGSHGHVIAFARQSGQRIVTIARRFEAPNVLLHHVDSFGVGLANSSHHYLTCLTREWWPRKRADNLSLGECDFGALFEALVDCEALSNSAKAGWQIPDQDQVEASKSRGVTANEKLISSEERLDFLSSLRQARKTKSAAEKPEPQDERTEQPMDNALDGKTGAAPAKHRADGFRYFRILRGLHQRLKPDWYLEIGTFTGSSLRFAERNFVAIDPAFQLHEVPPLKGREMIFFQDTSDAFFESPTAQSLAGKINLAFLDGLHHYEALLRDFTNVEPLMAPGGMVVLHDCLPYSVPMADRVQPPKAEWAGDVWKTLLILLEERPDLQIDILDAAPTGLVAIRGMKAAKKPVLAKRYDDLVAKWDPVSLDTFPGGIAGFYGRLKLRSATEFLSSL